MNPERHAELIVDYLEQNEVVGAILPRGADDANDRYEPSRVTAEYGWSGEHGAATEITFKIKAPVDRPRVNRADGGFTTTTQHPSSWPGPWEDVTIRYDSQARIDTLVEIRETDRFHISVSIRDVEVDPGSMTRTIVLSNLRQTGGVLFSIRIRQTGVALFREIKARGIDEDRFYKAGGLIGTVTGNRIDFTPFGLLPEPVRRPVPGPALADAVASGLISQILANIMATNGINRLTQFQADAFQAVNRSRHSDWTNAGLLLTAGTGGGKTEAFVFPLLESLVEDRAHLGIRGIFVYPMKALEADQARRFMMYIERLNRNRQHPITLGIYDGDTPRKMDDIVDAETRGRPLKNPFSICPVDGCGGEIRFAVDRRGVALDSPTCQDCGTSYSWLRMTRDDITSRWPHIVVTNPDMLHRGLSGTFSWRDQCWFGRPVYLCATCGKYKASSTKTERGELTCQCGGNLTGPHSLAPTQLVLDEAHLYKGVFGSQVALLLARIRQVASHYGHSPLFVGASATVAAPDQFGEQLFGGPVEVVAGTQINDAAAPILRYHLFLLPVKVSVLNAVGQILAGCFVADRWASEANRVLVFSDSKRTVYQLEGSLPPFYATLRGGAISFDEPDPTTRSHTADLSRDERREIERGFDIRDIRVLLATQTLEVGVDFDALPLEIQIGATYSYNDYIQRVGRVGRRNTPALVICVLRPQIPLDYYYFEHCRELIQFSPDTLDDVPLRSDNPFIVDRHVPAAVADYLIGASPGARLVWQTREAARALVDCRADALDYLRNVFIKPHSEDADLIQESLDAGLRRSSAVISDDGIAGKTLERLSTIIQMSIRTQDVPVEVDLVDFEQHAGISVAGDVSYPEEGDPAEVSMEDEESDED